MPDRSLPYLPLSVNFFNGFKKNEGISNALDSKTCCNNKKKLLQVCIWGHVCMNPCSFAQCF